MSKIARIMQQATAGAAGAGLDVDEAFSTYLYDGTGSAQTITNGIDLSGEGGLVWLKRRDGAEAHFLYDTERGTSNAIFSNQTNGNTTISNAVTSFNSDGFTLGTYDSVNSSDGHEYVSWTFRKAPSFFDIQTYTGDGSYMYVNHNLGSTPGMIIVKSLDSQSDADAVAWHVWHRNIGTRRLHLNSTSYNAGAQRIDAVGSSSFRVGVEISNSGKNYVAYIFAHNNNDGIFGPKGNQDIIKCGSYTGNDSDSTPIDVNLGFEPQWLFIKNAASVNRNWVIVDTNRGFTYGNAGSSSETTDRSLCPNLQSSEETCSTSTAVTRVDPTSTGFTIRGKSGTCNELGNHIYVAIRRGSLFTPTDATKVFAPLAYTTTDGSWQDRILESNFTTDLSINGYRNISDGGTHTFVDRLRGGDGGYATILRSHQTNAESIRTGDYYRWPQTGQSVTSNEWSKYNAGNGLNYYNYQWKRAPGYFDMVAYTGTGSATTVSHNLGVAPEMIWTKNRDASANWCVYHKGLNSGTNPENYKVFLNLTNAESTGSNRWNDTAPTSSVFSVGTSSQTNGSGNDMIAYLFATVAGVSKVGSFTGTTSDLTIDCGFSSGARFVLIKLVSGSGDWVLWDSTRGIVSGNDPYFLLNSTAAEVTNTDFIDPHSSGFTVTAGYQNNLSEYIFYAIA